MSNAENISVHVVTELSPPDQIMLNGEVAGLATSKVIQGLDKAKIEWTIEMYPWARAYSKAQQEPNTLIYSMARTEERDRLFDWLMPITTYTLGWVGLSDRDDIRIVNVEDAKHYRIVVQRDDISHQWLLKQGFIEGENFITCSDIHCSWQLLLNKNVDVIIESPDLIAGMLKQFNLPPNSAKYISAIPELNIIAYVAINKNSDPEVLSKLKAAFSDQ